MIRDQIKTKIKKVNAQIENLLIQFPGDSDLIRLKVGMGNIEDSVDRQWPLTEQDRKEINIGLYAIRVLEGGPYGDLCKELCELDTDLTETPEFIAGLENILRKKKRISVIAWAHAVFGLVFFILFFALRPELEPETNPLEAILLGLSMLPYLIIGGTLSFFAGVLAFLVWRIKRGAIPGILTSVAVICIGVLGVLLTGIGGALAVADIFKKTADVSTDYDVTQDRTHVWDKQVVGNETFLLVQNLEGFHDIMEGVRLYRYPTKINSTWDKYDDAYLIFDEAVDDMVNGKPRSVESAKFDIKNRKVYVKFNRGNPQILDVSKYKLLSKENKMHRSSGVEKSDSGASIAFDNGASYRKLWLRRTGITITGTTMKGSFDWDQVRSIDYQPKSDKEGMLVVNFIGEAFGDKKGIKSLGLLSVKDWKDLVAAINGRTITKIESTAPGN
jgi:hypothetical protein